MSVLNCNCRNNCSVIALVTSLIIGIIAAFLRITAVITVSDAFLWALFGIAVTYLAVLIITYSINRYRECFDPTLILIGILGTILLSTILLGIDFVATSVARAVAVGLLLFFFFLTVSESACFIRCISDRDDG